MVVSDNREITITVVSEITEQDQTIILIILHLEIREVSEMTAVPDLADLTIAPVIAADSDQAAQQEAAVVPDPAEVEVSEEADNIKLNNYLKNNVKKIFSNHEHICGFFCAGSGCFGDKELC